MRTRLCLLALLPLLGAAAAPITPPSDDTVLLQRAPGAAKALRAARGVVAPEAPVSAEAVAAAIAAARRTGDPRYYGQAQALLGAAWSGESPPAELRLLRATLRQQRHDFAGARADLDAVLAADPRNAQAHLIRATLSMVQGEPARAKPDCAALIGQTGLLVTATCIGAAGGLMGQGTTALAAIEQSLARDADAPVAVRLWALTQAAEIAERMGDAVRAEAHFKTALAAAQAAGENDVYLQAAYADFLLLQQRPIEVRALLKDARDFDPLLLRLALAETGEARTRLAQEVQARFALAAARGDAPHHREQAMAALHLATDAAAALQLAQANWAGQREPADALILVQAATAARDKAAAQPVRDWQQATGIDDVRLQALVKTLESLP